MEEGFHAEVQAFFLNVLRAVIEAKIGSISPLVKCAFKGVLAIQDSTIVQLPTSLFEEFSGVSNGHTQVCNARIQYSFDLISGDIIDFSINSYSKTDHGSAPELPINEGDLTVRDRGYFSKKELDRHINNGAHFIFRYKFKTKAYDIDSNEELDIHGILKKKKCIDQYVRLKNGPVVRIVGKKATEEIATQRRRKAKAEKKPKPSQEYLDFCDYSLYITNLEGLSFDDIVNVYRLRWRIETMFKYWKSNINLEAFHKMSSNQLHVIFYARMTMVTMLIQTVYPNSREKIYELTNRYISMEKLFQYAVRWGQAIDQLVTAIIENVWPQKVTEAMEAYCCYEKRRRKNYEDHLLELTEIFH